MEVSFLSLVRQVDIFKIEKKLETSRLNLSQADIQPTFPRETFSAEYYQDLTYKIAKKTKSIAGVLKDSTSKLEDDKLIVFLAYGGKDLLIEKNFDRELKKLIKKEFDLDLNIIFDGNLSTDCDSSKYIEKQKREELTERIEVYEANLNERSINKKIKKVISVRNDKNLFPKVLLQTAVPIYGGIIKDDPIDISSITPDIGSATVWGDVFFVDGHLTKDGTKKIYSVYITDYTNSILIKIIAAKEKWIKL